LHKEKRGNKGVNWERSELRAIPYMCNVQLNSTETMVAEDIGSIFI